jgi:hypothetical protein
VPVVHSSFVLSCLTFDLLLFFLGRLPGYGTGGYPPYHHHDVVDPYGVAPHYEGGYNPAYDHGTLSVPLLSCNRALSDGHTAAGLESFEEYPEEAFVAPHHYNAGPSPHEDSALSDPAREVEEQ